jgi:hypothetical protein
MSLREVSISDFYSEIPGFKYRSAILTENFMVSLSTQITA